MLKSDLSVKEAPEYYQLLLNILRAT